jgi:hypothetical protein
MKYLEQLNRVRRFLKRVETLHRTSAPWRSDENKRLEYEDMLWAFFQNCWHLKDWIKNDLDAPNELRHGLEKALESGSYIPLCADLANRNKHLSLRINRRNGKLQARFTITVGGPLRILHRYQVIYGDGDSLGALDVARGAVEEWEKLINSHGRSI